MSKVLLKYIPEEAIPLVSHWFKAYQFHLRITKSRTSKFGDFRPAFNGKPNRISVNGDLNRFHFLITLTHEAAHAACWEKYKGKVLPHGVEWQTIYAQLLKDLINQVFFPKDLLIALKRHLNKPKASSCSDPELYKAIKIFDDNPKETIYLDRLALGELFTVNGKKIFRKGNKRRRRYECEEINSKRMYLVSGHAEVKVIGET